MKLSIIDNLNKENLKDNLKTINPTDNGYAGFKSIDYLLNYVEWAAFSDSKDITSINMYLDLKDINNVIESSIEKLEKVYKLKSELEIYIFPTASKFVLEKMEGISGYSPYKNVFHLYIHVDKNVDDTTIVNSIAHEYNHLMRYEYFYDDYSFLEAIISEGLAENFREYVFGGNPEKWSIALKKDEAKKIFNDLVKTFEVREYTSDDYNNIFFGSDKFKMWTGYSIGYYLVKDYLDKQKDIFWKEIVRKSAIDIVKDSTW